MHLQHENAYKCQIAAVGDSVSIPYRLSKTLLGVMSMGGRYWSSPPSRPLTSDHSPFHSSSKSSFTPPMQTPDTLEQMYVCVCVGRLPRRWRCVRGNDRSRDICTPPQPIIAMFPEFLAPLDEPPPPFAIGVRRSFCFVCLRLPSLCLNSARPYPTPFLYLPRLALSLGILHSCTTFTPHDRRQILTTRPKPHFQNISSARTGMTYFNLKTSLR